MSIKGPLRTHVSEKYEGPESPSEGRSVFKALNGFNNRFFTRWKLALDIDFELK